MVDERLNYLLLVLTTIFLVIMLYFGSEIPGNLTALRSRPSQTEDSTALLRLSLINQAVTEKPATKTFEYTGGFQNPFKEWNAARIRRRRTGTSASKAQAARMKFVLKGILTKNKPLAILEDGLGETYIRGIGEKALDQTIVGIAKNRVTMRDHLGTYVLVVEEN